MATLKVTNIKNESFAGDQLYLKTDGKIGIGTTAPDQMLHIKGDTPYIKFEDDNDNQDWQIEARAFFSIYDVNDSAHRLVIDGSGNVGIGTTSPGRQLSIVNSSGAIAEITTNTSGNTSALYLHEGAIGSTSNGGAILYDGANNKVAICCGTTLTTERITIDRDNGDVEIGGNLKTNNFSSERNVIINGGMQISQRGSDWTSVAASAYHLDRWYYYTQNSSAQVRIRHSGDGPNNFHQSYRVNCTTADTSIASNEEIKVIQKIEGFNVQQFEKGTSTAKKFALSFYIKCNKNGTYIVELYDRDNGRDCSGSYTISDGNWNKHTIEFPVDTTGGFDFDHASSLEIQFWLVAGSAVQGGSLNTTWRTSADSGSATGQVNFTDSTSNEWMLTGVQLEPSVCTEFNHKLYGEDLALCQRYYQVLVDAAGSGTQFSFGNATCFSSSSLHLVCPLQSEMRTTPTLDYTTGTDYYKAYQNNTNDAFDSWSLVGNSHSRCADLMASSGVSVTAAASALMRTGNAASRIAFTAEL